MEFQPPEWVDRVTSTNTVLLERLEAGLSVPAGTVLATLEQTAGRGRGARRWLTHPGLDLACSIVLHVPAETRHLGSLSMAVALGVTDLLTAQGVAARTKWPNDVVVGRRKICGILPELPRRRRQSPPPGPAPADPAPLGTTVVVGVGLNVAMSRTEAAAIDQPATSLLIETGRVTPARQLLPELLAALAPRLEAWRAGGFAALRADWEGTCVWLGRAVVVVDGAARRRGRLVGFGANGELLLDEGEGPKPVWTGHLRAAGDGDVHAPEAVDAGTHSAQTHNPEMPT